jgi:hypothetical protein
MKLHEVSKILDRMEASSPDPWDTTVTTDGGVTLTSVNQEVLAENISVEDAWYTSHSREDIKHLIDEVLDLRRLVFDIHVLLEDKEEHGIIRSYIDAVMESRM